MNRRSMIVAMPLLAITSRVIAKTYRPDFAAIERQSDGRLGVFAIDTNNGRTLDWRARDRFPFCSSAKAPLAAFVLWLVDHGRLRLDQPVRFTADDLLPYAPITRAAAAGGVLPIMELCRAAVTMSDNTAANLLWRETGGPKAMTAWMRSQGDKAFDLSSVEPGLNLSRYGDLINTTTPEAMAGSLRRFVSGNVLSPASRQLLIDWMIANTTGGKRLRAGLPPSWQVGDKTGTYNEKWFSTVDIAVTWPVGRAPIFISGFLTGTPNTANAEETLRAVARQVMQWATT